MNLHILTPFYRKKNFDVQFRRLEQFASWTCIITINEHQLSYGNFFRNKGCKIYVCNNFLGDAAYCKVNRYISGNIDNIQDNDYYMPLMDDDVVPYNFMEKLRSKNIKSSIIIVSCTRGDKSPPREKYMVHKTGNLIAAKENMRPGKIAYCQQIFRGSILKKIRYNEDHHYGKKPSGDGLMARFLVKNYEDITYVPDIFVFFNYLERGRYSIELL